MAKVKVFVTPKKGILDPQGKAVESALHSMGYKNVTGMRVGKYLEFELSTNRPNHPATRKQIDEMSKKLLSNPIIEDYHFEVAE